MDRHQLRGICMKVKLPLKIMDVTVILLSLGLTVLSGFAAYTKTDDVQVVIKGSTQSWIYPLDTEETVRVRGPLGYTVVRIHEGEAWVESSPCENQTCVRMGHINANSFVPWVACLPNSVMFIIEGSNDNRDRIDGTAW